MSNEFDHSIRFDPDIDCNSASINYVVSQLVTQIDALGRNRRWHKKHIDHIKIIVLNLYITAFNDRTRYVAYSRNKATYTELRKSRYVGFKLAYDSMTNMVDALTELKYIEGVNGFSFKQINYCRNARMKATDKLIELFLAFAVRPTEITRLQPKDVIIMTIKDGDNKIPISFEESNETSRMRNNLNLINSELQRHFIGLNVTDDYLTEIRNATKGIKVEDYDAYENYYVEEIAYEKPEKIKKDREKYKAPLDLSKGTLTRIFCNGAFDQGGRFYHGWWQSVPSRYRAYIAIDDKPTAEIDFSGIHINLLYLREGLPLPLVDVYTIDCFPDGVREIVRNVMKIALQIILNSESEKSALWTMRHHEKINRYVNLFNVYSHKQILDAFKVKHKAIEKYFYSGIGVYLQFEDSEIAEDILLYLIKKGIVALPIHDSFIVQEEHEDILRSAMDEAVSKRYGQVLKLKADKTAYELDRQFLVWNSHPEDIPLSKEEYLSEYQSEKNGEYQQSRDRWYSEREHLMVAPVSISTGKVR